MAILDTNFIIEYLWNVPYAADMLDVLEQRGEILKTTSINVYELVKGAERSPNRDKDIERLYNFIRQLEVVHFNNETAKIGGKIFADLAKTGKMIDDFDVMIASIALELDETVVTKNIKHFERIKGLKIETY